MPNIINRPKAYCKAFFSVSQVNELRSTVYALNQMAASTRGSEQHAAHAVPAEYNFQHGSTISC